MTSRRGLLVAGTHRSGTSALTRTLGFCGAALPRSPVMPRAGDSDTDYWESRAIYRLHRELLESIGVSDMNPGEIPPGWYRSLGAAYFRRRFVAALHRDFGDATLFVVKDPRACLFLPLWLSVFDAIGAEPGIVIPVRNPVEVAASLHARQGLPVPAAMALWLRSFLAAERDSRAVRRSFLRYDDLLRDWRVVVARIGTDLGIDWPRLNPVTEAAIDVYLRGDRRHHTAPLDGAGVSADVATAYRWALDAAAGKPADSAVLDRISLAPENSSRAFSPFLAVKYGPVGAATAIAQWRARYALRQAGRHAIRPLVYLRRHGVEATGHRIVREIASTRAALR